MITAGLPRLLCDLVITKLFLLLLGNREWKHEKKHGNAHSEKSIECLKHKFNLLVPWGDHESRSDKKLMQVIGKLSKAKLKMARKTPAKKSPTMRRLEHKGKQNHVKRHSMAFSNYGNQTI